MKWVKELLTFDGEANLTKADTVEKSAKLFSKAKHSIHIAAGNINSPFYESSQVVSVLKDAAAKGRDVTIVYDPNRTKGKFSKDHVSRVPNVVVLKANKPITRHFVVIDGKHVRIERQHGSAAQNSPAVIFNNASPLAQELDATFEELAESASAK